MKKKLDTRFPAARIKKIMQADEDVGKIAMAVPVLVSKALELFLQDLCDRTYDITLQRGAKTLNSLHLRYCVQSYNEYDFLREIVNKVADYGHSDAADDRTVSKRRKAVGDEFNESDEESKRNKMQENASGSGRGRGRVRGRGRGRGRRGGDLKKEPIEVQSSAASIQSTLERINDTCSQTKELPKDSNNSIITNSTASTSDINLGTEDKLAKPAIAKSSAAAPNATSATVHTEVMNEEYPGWSASEIDKMAVDPRNFAHLGTTLNDEDEDYDEE